MGEGEGVMIRKNGIGVAKSRTGLSNWTEEEDQYSKEVEMKQELELTLRALEMELKTVRNDLNQVEQSLVKFSNFWHYVNIMYSIPLI